MDKGLGVRVRPRVREVGLGSVVRARFDHVPVRIP